MKKKTLLTLVMVLILASSIGYWKWKTRDYSDPLKAERKARSENSIKVINHGLAQEPSQLYQAMVSIATDVQPDTLSKIQSFASSNEKMVRAGVAFVMVYQKDEKSKLILQKLINDSEALVRSHVIHASRQQPTPDKEEILKSLLANKSLTEIEEIQAKSALYRCVQNRSEANHILEELVSRVNFDAQTKFSDLILLELNEIAPDHKRVIALNQKAINLSKNPAVLSRAIRSLANEKDPSIASNFSKWVHSTDTNIKRAAIETMHVICPAKRWEWIGEGFNQEKDFAMKSLWILAAERLKGKESIEFLSHALENAEKSKNSIEAQAIESALNRVKKTLVASPCVQKN